MSPFAKAVLNGCLGLILCLLLSSKARSEEKDPDVELLKDVGLKSDDASLIAFLRGRCVEGRNPENIAALIRKMGAKRFAEREQATKDMMRLGRFAVPELHEAAESKDREIAQRAKDVLKHVHSLPANDAPHSAIRLLVKRRAKEAVEVLLHYLPSADNEEAEVEVWYGLEELISKQGSIPEAVRQALKDREPSRRAVAACLLAWKGNKEDRAAARKCLHDADPHVRLRTAQGLLAAGDKSGLSALIRLLDEPEVALSWQAEELLHWTARDASPSLAIGSATLKERTRCREEWEKWLKTHAGKVDLANREKDGRRPGLFFICDSNYPENEKYEPCIWLRGCDGKARWTFSRSKDDGQIPGDILLLPGNKVLIYMGGLSQRDLQGKVLWRSEDAGGGRAGFNRTEFSFVMDPTLRASSITEGFC